MNCIRIGWGSVAPLHENKMNLCGVSSIGVIDINPEKTTIVEEKGIQFCKSYEDALKLKPHFWDICTPNDQHLSVMKRIITIDPEACILVEKPVCTFEQIDALRETLKDFRGKLVVNENYLSSQIADKIKELVKEYGLIPKKVVIEMDKNRTRDFQNGRYVAKNVFGYEGTHMLTILQHLGREFAPQKDTVIEKRDEGIEIPERLEKQGLVDISYTVNGVAVNLFTSMKGVIKHRYAPHCPKVKTIEADDVKTRYRFAAIEGVDKNNKTFTVVGFYEPIQGFDRSIGSVSVLNAKGEVVKTYEPIPDDTMGKHLARAVEYFKEEKDNPCPLEKGIEAVQLLHTIDS